MKKQESLSVTIGMEKFGYGGYKYIPGRWTSKKMIKRYKLNNNSKVLDVGCGKGFILYEIKILPELKFMALMFLNTELKIQKMK